MEAKHTPGPWIMKGNYPEDQAIIYDEATGTNIAVVYTGDGGNARLIAAAPDLLTQLQRTLVDLEDFCSDEPEFEWTPEAGRKICREIEQAIAKARVQG